MVKYEYLISQINVRANWIITGVSKTYYAFLKAMSEKLKCLFFQGYALWKNLWLISRDMDGVEGTIYFDLLKH